MTSSGKTGEHFVCIHAHFYQPPRENPWTEAIEVQDSAHPFHDWNEKISSECYATNGWARLLDANGRIRRVTNNYALVSFNFGPTLLSWMEANDPGTYTRILEGDRESVQARQGHGNALAQAYNHMILPLANRRDKVTQVRWGIADFIRRFGREPEGMWLPETAVDTETLEVLAEHAIRFTVLSPAQAARVRPLGQAHGDGRFDVGSDWQDVAGGRVDPSRPYLSRLPSGRSIVLFFYDGPISHAIAFEGLLADGEALSQRLFSGFAAERDWRQLVHVATDGESYGHHHRFGEMALTYALDRIARETKAALTNYGLFLAENPPAYEVLTVEPSSWSCVHGVERWRSDCGCNAGHPKWSQEWREVLRGALDWLRDTIDPLFEKRASRILTDPWAARNTYIACVLDRTRDQVESWLTGAARAGLTASDKVEALRLLEMERHRMLAYTSCGWFFDDISGIETVQVLRHATRALQLARSLGLDLEGEFARKLAAAHSNLPDMGDGASVYERVVRPSITDLEGVIAHHALTESVEERKPGTERTIYCYRIREVDWRKESYGENSLAIGAAEARSELTQETQSAAFGVLHFGGHDLHCATRRDLAGVAYEKAKGELFESFRRHTLTEVVRALDRNLGTRYYALRNIFLEERREIIGKVAEEDLKRLELAYRKIYEENRRLMEYLKESEVPLPRGFLVSAEYVLTRDLEEAARALIAGGPAERVREIVAEAGKWWIQLDAARVERTLRGAVEEKVDRIFSHPEAAAEEAAIAEIEILLRAAECTRSPLNLWRTQNLFHAHWSALRGAGKLSAVLRALGERLGFGPEILEA